MYASRDRVVSELGNMDAGLNFDQIFSEIYIQALYVSKGLAAAGDERPYSYHSVPTNTDYATIREWVINKLHLANIPAHYPIPDPSYLLQETIRFFHVDDNWTDNMICGVLSLANHDTDDPAKDFCRSALKVRLNEYLATPLKGLEYCQQMPIYGFFLRNQLFV